MHGNVEQFQQPLLVEAKQEFDGLIVDSAPIMPPKDGITQIVVRNNSGFTQKLDEGAVLGVVEHHSVLGQLLLDGEVVKVTVLDIPEQ